LLLFVSFVTISALTHNTLLADLTFVGGGASFVIQESDSHLKLNYHDDIDGWSERSIVRDRVNKTSDSWTPGYPAGSIISSSGSYVDPSPDLIYSNSNAIAKNAGDIATNTGNIATNTGNIATNTGNIAILNSAVTIYDTHQTYASNTTEENFVYFKDGFTVNADRTLTLHTPIPVTGNINLSDTGKINLANDLYLGSNAYLTNGGQIDGNGFALVLSCTFEVPENQVLQITGDTIINGHGTTLYLNPHAQITVDNNVTLTLKNVRIKNTRNSKDDPMISLSGANSKLALMDVELALADDFWFTEGHMFIHDDVVVSGSSQFIYRTTESSYIEDAAMFGIDPDSTFFYAPESTSNNLINMLSKTSGMYFDGSTLKTTTTGIRLSKGMLCFDNNVTITSAASEPEVVWVSVGAVFSQLDRKNYGNYVRSVAWRPTGNYLAVGGFDGDISPVRVYSFNGTSFTLEDSNNFAPDSKVGLSDINSVDWSPDGAFLAVAGDGGDDDEIDIYSFDGSSLTFEASQLIGPSAGISPIVRTVSWSPDGNHLVAGLEWPENNNHLRVYSFNKVTPALTQVQAFNPGAYVYGTSWQHIAGGSYVAIAMVSAAGNEIKIYYFNPGTQTLSQSVAQNYGGANANSVAWRPGSNHLAVGGGSIGGNDVQVYSFSTTGSTLSSVVGVDFGGPVKSVSWSPDGKNLAVGGNTSSGGHLDIELYEFNATVSSLTRTAQGNYGTLAYSTSWSFDGNYVGVGGQTTAGGHDEIEVYSVPSSEERLAVNPQTFSNGIIFGDSSVTDGDLDVKVLAAARVEIEGIVVDNSSV